MGKVSPSPFLFPKFEFCILMKNSWPFLMVVFVMLGCSKDQPEVPAPTTPTYGTLTFRFHNSYNDQPIRLAGSAYYNNQGDTLQIDRLTYLISEIVLTKSNGSKVELNGVYALIDEASSRHTFQIENVPEGHYTGIDFLVGLDSATNHGDPTLYPPGHPLDPIYNMHWSWSGGYIFMALEGRFTADMDELFQFHQALNPFVMPVGIPGNFQFAGSDTLHLELQVDALFNDPNPIDLDVDYVFVVDQDPQSTAMRFKENVSGAFRFWGQ